MGDSIRAERNRITEIGGASVPPLRPRPHPHLAAASNPFSTTRGWTPAPAERRTWDRGAIAMPLGEDSERRL